MPVKQRQITFRPVATGDLAMLEDWMSRPHWRKWWGDPVTEMGYVRDMLAGCDTTKPFIFSLNDEPVGYIQYWFVGDAKDPKEVEESPWIEDLPTDAIGIDMSIGNADNLSKGVGSDALSEFIGELTAKGFDKIIIDPHPDNHRAIRAYEKAGFRPIPHLEGQTKDALVMQLELNG